MEKGFRKMLAERQRKVNSLVCVGLDPLPEKLPGCLMPGGHPEDFIAEWMMSIADATAPYACMFKPNRAHFEAFWESRFILTDIVEHIHKEHPDIPVFLDCKRGDIGRTQERYRVAHFELDGADGMNFSPYMGKDCMQYLLGKDNNLQAIVGLCYTSNPSAREMQDVRLEDGRLYYEYVADRILAWAKDLGIVENSGLVMAAAFENPKGSGNIFSEHLTRVRKIVRDDLWFLIPGIGTQGGFVEQTIMEAYSGPGTVAINSTSGIIFASSGEDYAEAAAMEAKKLRDQIRDAGGNVV